jgi:hypothetical protein
MVYLPVGGRGVREHQPSAVLASLAHEEFLVLIFLSTTTK